MDRADVETRARKLVIEHLGVDKVEDTDNFIDDLGADSLDVVELIMAFEEEFDKDISDDAADKIATFKDAVDFIVAEA